MSKVPSPGFFRRAVGGATAAFIFPAAVLSAGHVGTAKSSMEAGRYEEAISILSASCRSHAEDLPAHFYLAYCYGVTGRWEEARRTYERCAALDPDRPEIYYNLGVILHKLDLYDEAARAFEEALLLDPGRVDANFNCGLAHYYGHRPVQAIKFFREALALAPDDVSVLYCLALAYEEIDARVALSMWEDYVNQAQNVAAEAPFLNFARRHLSTLRAGEKP